MTPSVVVPRVERPLVSVVMVVYGQWGWTRRALHALVARTPPVYELVVVDNASPGRTGAELREQVAGARIVGADHNTGFGVGNDLGVLHSRAEHVVLLNSDCLVEPGWLEPMLERVERDPSVGAVAGKLLDLDGTLQEGGSLLDRDATTRAYGRGAGPMDPQASFPRDVLFGSAGFLLLRRAAFDAVGGFDPVFTPAYFEDVDLALALEARGYRCVYEPRSIARHVREASTPSGTSGALMKAHRPIVQERWGERLATLPTLAEVDRYPHRAYAVRDALTAERVLVVGPDPAWLPGIAARAARTPWIRWTVVDARVDPAAMASGVEFATGEPGAELEARRFHASFVVVGPRAPAGAEPAIRRTQPQATTLDSVEQLDDRAEPAVTAASRPPRPRG
ncbi:MAG: glycosyltransferase family 2 protein [Acidimicrobiia bacterium]